jgi:hypothetical protein
MGFRLAGDIAAMKTGPIRLGKLRRIGRKPLI